MTIVDIELLRQWIGKSENATDCVTPVPARAMKATLDHQDISVSPGDRLPPMWHILYFLPVCKQSELSDNGHSKTGNFMPPVPLPRRMYAGGRMIFHQHLRVGDKIARESTIADVSFKQGRSGPLVFLKINHEISNPGGPAVTEEQDIVYRQQPAPGDPVPSYQTAPQDEQWRREMSAGPVMLFRFSALTFNGHRIHFDQPYTTAVEGYPGLVVHGPLLAMLLLDLLRQQLPDAQLREFQFRALKPVFDSVPFFLCGAPDGDQRVIRLWVRDPEGHLCLDASATLS